MEAVAAKALDMIVTGNPIKAEEAFKLGYCAKIVEGDLVVGCDAQGNGGERFDAYTFACRPPGALHGPFVSRGGCVMLEFQYYD